MTLSRQQAHEIKVADAAEELLPAIRERWSPRSFTDRAVGAAELKILFEAARWAPSSGNGQPWRYVMGVKGTETHAKIAETLAGYNQDWAPKAPVLILGVTRTLGGRHDTPNPYALYDLGAATAILTVEAAALGLATHQMGGFDHAAVRAALGIPEEYALGSVMAVGYLGEPAALPNESLIAREIEPRSRKPLSEIVFSAWDEPANLS